VKTPFSIVPSAVFFVLSACGPKPVHTAQLAPVEAQTQAPAAPAATPGSTNVVQGRAIGPVELGMSGAALRDLGMAWHAVAKRGVPTRVISGPYEVVLKDEKVTHITLTLNPDVQVSVAGKAVPPDVTLEELTKFFADCSSLGELGTNDVFACGKPSTLIERDRESNKLAIRVVASTTLETLY
jgi:hypothetical protein